MKFDQIEHFFEKIIFNSRWILVIFYAGLVLTLFLLAIKFVKEFVHFASIFWAADESHFLTGILGMVDKTLLANLLILVIFSGYENFVSVIGIAKTSEDRPKWMGGVDFAGLKIKLIGSIIALSGINLLAAFLEIESANKENLGWMIGVHLSFVLTGLLFAFSEKIGHFDKKNHHLD
jgi:uncharacterized protein (TIGR00645 family)